MKLVLQGEVWAGETNLVAVSTGMVFRAVSLGDVTTECGTREEVKSWQPWGTQHCGEVRKSGRGWQSDTSPSRQSRREAPPEVCLLQRRAKHHGAGRVSMAGGSSKHETNSQLQG